MSDGRNGRERIKFPAYVKTPRGRVDGEAWYEDGWLKDNFVDLEDAFGTDSPDAPIIVRDMTGEPFPEFLPKKKKNATSEQRFWYSVRIRHDLDGLKLMEEGKF